ncbi:hypothetical protein B0H15DRAFT_932783 [Mycena belliarum]|uniref:Uncharacterized protein n=1 Tax=Mycena belliarum TaxID=1033014 RepID=A0AAD6TXU4_9AGAR|nr:hypothetical protein B0H15DRAFT_932783 [Mycena belliae]
MSVERAEARESTFRKGAVSFARVEKWRENSENNRRNIKVRRRHDSNNFERKFDFERQERLETAARARLKDQTSQTDESAHRMAKRSAPLKASEPVASAQRLVRIEKIVALQMKNVIGMNGDTSDASEGARRDEDEGRKKDRNTSACHVRAASRHSIPGGALVNFRFHVASRSGSSDGGKFGTFESLSEPAESAGQSPLAHRATPPPKVKVDPDAGIPGRLVFPPLKRPLVALLPLRSGRRRRVRGRVARAASGQSPRTLPPPASDPRRHGRARTPALPLTRRTSMARTPPEPASAVAVAVAVAPPTRSLPPTSSGPSRPVPLPARPPERDARRTQPRASPVRRVQYGGTARRSRVARGACPIPSRAGVSEPSESVCARAVDRDS